MYVGAIDSKILVEIFRHKNVIFNVKLLKKCILSEIVIFVKLLEPQTYTLLKRFIKI